MEACRGGGVAVLFAGRVGTLDAASDLSCASVVVLSRGGSLMVRLV